VLGKPVCNHVHWFNGDNFSRFPNALRCNQRNLTNIRAHIDNDHAGFQNFFQKYNNIGAVITHPENPTLHVLRKTQSHTVRAVEVMHRNFVPHQTKYTPKDGSGQA